MIAITEPSQNVAPTNNAARKEEEQRIQRTAEREGRRTRRRRGKFYLFLFCVLSSGSMLVLC